MKPLRLPTSAFNHRPNGTDQLFEGPMHDEDVQQLIALPIDELRERARIPFRIMPNNAALMDHFAQEILQEIRTHNRTGEPTRLILPIGPVAQYRKAIEISNRERISWRNVYSFNMDEFLDWQGRPIPNTHPLSFEGYMRREVFGKLDPDLRIPDRNVFFPHPFRIDELSDKIEELGGIDVCYGGIGYHGHIAFNEPPLSRWHRISVEELRNSKTRVVALGSDSILNQSIGCAGGCSSAIPPMAVTIGMRDVLAAKKMRLYCAAGERHRTIFRISVAGSVCIEYPSTLVQGHPDAEVITDEPTAEPISVGIR